MLDDGAAVRLVQRIALRGLPGASKAEAAERDKMNVEDI